MLGGRRTGAGPLVEGTLMTRLAALGAIGASLLTLTYVALIQHPVAPRRDDRVRVIVDAGSAAPSPPATSPSPSLSLPEPVAAAPVIAVGAPPRDRAALADLLAGQSRDPGWAPGAEAELRSRLGAGSSATCAAFLCRVETVPPDRPDARSPDEQAAALTQGWPARLSYNRATAAIVADGAAPRLVFYVTRASEADEAAAAG